MNKYVVFLLLILFPSCGDEFGEETNYVLNENKEWLVTGDQNSQFIMVDNNSISQSFSMNGNSSDFSESTSGYFFIRTKVTKTESYTQSFSSNFGQGLSYILTAGDSPYGDELYVSLNEISFAYDFKFNVLSRLSFAGNYMSKSRTDKGFEVKKDFNSSIEFLDSLVVNGKQYSGIMHFTFLDFNDKWTKFTVKELFIAKHIGLIKYSLNNGIIYERQ